MALQAELDMIRNSKGWRLLNIVRDLRSSLRHALEYRYRQGHGGIDPNVSYSQWIEHVEKRAYKPGRIKKEIANFDYKPTISVVMPAYNTPIEILNLAIQVGDSIRCPSRFVVKGRMVQPKVEGVAELCVSCRSGSDNGPDERDDR